MPTPATTIDECIQFAPNYIALIAYGTEAPLLSQMQAWIAGIFSASTGIFPTSADNSEIVRRITNWYVQHLIAEDEIEGPALGDAGAVGTSAVINAVERVLFAILNGASSADKTAVVALFNAVWAIPAASVAAFLTTATDMAAVVTVTNGGPPVDWAAVLTWNRLGQIGNGKLLVYVQDPRAPDIEVRDNELYVLGNHSWIPQPGTVCVVNGDLATVTVAAIEAAINSISQLCQVTTHDVAHAAYKGSAGTLTSQGAFAGGV